MPGFEAERPSIEMIRGNCHDGLPDPRTAREFDG